MYLIALAGLATFYGLERAAKASRGRSREKGGKDMVEAGTIWLHIGSMAVLLGIVAITLRFFEFDALHFRWNDNAYASAAWI